MFRTEWGGFFGKGLKYLLDIHQGKPSFLAEIKVEGPRMMEKTEYRAWNVVTYDFVAEFRLGTGHRARRRMRFEPAENIRCVYNIWGTLDEDGTTVWPCIVEYNWTMRDIIQMIDPPNMAELLDILDERDGKESSKAEGLGTDEQGLSLGAAWGLLGAYFQSWTT